MKEFTDLQGLETGQIWEHKNGNIYEIFDFVNREAGRQDEYPTWVCYRNIYTGAKYGRAVVRWHGSFTRRLDLEKNGMQKFKVVLKYSDEKGDGTWTGNVSANGANTALEWGKEAILRDHPTAQVTWANVTGAAVSGMQVIK